MPIIKDKCDKIDSKDNYRPIALVSIVSQIGENILLDRMSGVLSTIYYLLSTIYCLLSTIYCLLSTIYYLLSTIYYLLSTIYFLLSTIYCLLSTIYYLLSTIYCLLSTIYCLLSTIYYLLSTIYYLLSTMCSQFGFKKKRGTDMCIYVLKEVIDRHRCLNGSTFMCFFRCI